MAYTRREVKNGVTVMNKDLYDNLQDGIDEVKEALKGIVLPASVEDNGASTVNTTVEE